MRSVRGLMAVRAAAAGFSSGAAPAFAPTPAPAASAVRAAAPQSAAAEEPAPFAALFNQQIRPLLDVVDRIRPYLAGERIELPAIVVVGDQSSGKSSVLESISGIALPRGTNIVTRCPLELQLRHDSETYAVISRPAAVGLFGGDPSKVVSERLARLEDIGPAIERFTAEICGANKGVSDRPISLRVHRPDAPDLTLIDLPGASCWCPRLAGVSRAAHAAGITRVPVGDQPEDIYLRVKTMIMKYIRGEEKVILCIIPANGPDFSTAEGVLLARSVDPQQRRTLGVVTKVDRAEGGIRARLLAEEESDLKLQLGFIAVRNRTQEEVSAREPLSRVRAREAAFFQGHPELSQLVGSDLLGMGALERRLVAIQAEALKACLPKIKRKVAEQKAKVLAELKGMRSAVTTEQESVLLFSERLNQVQRMFSGAAEGDFRAVNHAFRDWPSEALNRLHVAPRVYESFTKFQQDFAAAMPDFLSEKHYAHMEALSRETRGASLANFLSSPVFSRCYTDSVHGKLAAPAEALVEAVRALVTAVFESLVEREFGAWPRAAALVKQHVNELLDDGQAAATHLVRGLCEQQRHIFTLNPFYMDTVAKFKRTVADIRDAASAPPPQQQQQGGMRMPDPLGLGAAFGAMQPQPPKQETSWLGRVPKDLLDIADEAFLSKAARATSGEEIGIREMQLSLKVYSKVVMRRVGDDVPLAVLEHLVIAVGEGLAVAVQRKAQGAQLAPLLQDDPTTVARRQRLERSLVNLSAAWDELNNVV